MSDFQEKLDELRKKQPAELTADDLAFLKARRSYLHADEIALFKLEEEAAAAKPAKKAKKAADDESEE